MSRLGQVFHGVQVSEFSPRFGIADRRLAEALPTESVMQAYGGLMIGAHVEDESLKAQIPGLVNLMIRKKVSDALTPRRASHGELG